MGSKSRPPRRFLRLQSIQRVQECRVGRRFIQLQPCHAQDGVHHDRPVYGTARVVLPAGADGRAVGTGAVARDASPEAGGEAAFQDSSVQQAPCGVACTEHDA